MHGEAVAIGTILAFDLSVQLGFCTAETIKRVRRHFEFVGLPTAFPILDGHVWRADRLLAHMSRDKKIRNGRQILILARGIGKAFSYEQATESEILEVLQTYVG